jgi:hypothetical protein
VGFSGNQPTVLTRSDTIAMPHGSELMMLPDRFPIVYDPDLDRFETLTQNPYAPDERIFPVAVFNSPGYVNRHVCAYTADFPARPLPLFSYGAVGFGAKRFRSAALQVDTEPRQDLRLDAKTKSDPGGQTDAEAVSGKPADAAFGNLCPGIRVSGRQKFFSASV